MDFAASVSDEQANESRETIAAARSHIRARLPPGTIMALPTAPSIAPPVAATGEALELFRVRTMRLTCIAGIAGLPQINIPAGTVSGCPAGLSLIGWPGADEVLLDFACRLAHLCGIQM
jgi:amidase